MSYLDGDVPPGVREFSGEAGVITLACESENWCYTCVHVSVYVHGQFMWK